VLPLFPRRVEPAAGAQHVSAVRIQPDTSRVTREIRGPKMFRVGPWQNAMHAIALSWMPEQAMRPSIGSERMCGRPGAAAAFATAPEVCGPVTVGSSLMKMARSAQISIDRTTVLGDDDDLPT
jgi:hypothetical protein